MVQKTYGDNVVEHFIDIKGKIIEAYKLKMDMFKFLKNKGFVEEANRDEDYVYYRRVLDDGQLELLVKTKTSLTDTYNKLFLLSCFNDEWVQPFNFDQVEDLKKAINDIIAIPTT